MKILTQRVVAEQQRAQRQRNIFFRNHHKIQFLILWKSSILSVLVILEGTRYNFSCLSRPSVVYYQVRVSDD